VVKPAENGPLQSGLGFGLILSGGHGRFLSVPCLARMAKLRAERLAREKLLELGD
jgi:hypothetical protein